MSTELFSRHASFEGRKDALVKNLKGVADDADDLMKEVANSTAEEFAEVYAKVEARLGAAKSQFDDVRRVVGSKARDAAEATEDYVLENPWKSIGIAATGILIGFLISRR